MARRKIIAIEVEIQPSRASRRPDICQRASAGPFGAGNPNPVFHASGVELVDGPRRLKERHLKMAFRQDGRVLRGVAWRAADREAFLREHRASLDLAFSLEHNEWNGERYLELSVADFRASEGTGDPGCESVANPASC